MGWVRRRHHRHPRTHRQLRRLTHQHHWRSDLPRVRSPARQRFGPDGLHSRRDTYRYRELTGGLSRRSERPAGTRGRSCPRSPSSQVCHCRTFPTWSADGVTRPWMPFVPWRRRWTCHSPAWWATEWLPKWGSTWCWHLSLIHISEPTRRTPISYAVFCLKKKKTTTSIIKKLSRK